MSYEVNTNDRHFASRDPKAVASVAVAWSKAKLAPKAWAIYRDSADLVRCVEVPVSAVRDTAKALAAAAN